MHIYDGESLPLRVLEAEAGITFLLGSGTTLSVVPGVSEIVDLTEQYIREYPWMSDVPSALQDIQYDDAPVGEKYGRYQDALRGVFGADVFDAIIRHAVLYAYRYADREGASIHEIVDRRRVDMLTAAAAETDVANWLVPPGIQALAKFAKRDPARLNHEILTTNFDPIIEIALRREGLGAVSTSLKTDGSIDATIAPDPGLRVVHLHGFWRGNKRDNRPLLHSPKELAEPRDHLLAALADRIRDSLVVVVGYGGWDDVFIGALNRLTTDRRVDVLWALYASSEDDVKAESDAIAKRIPNADVDFYTGIDADSFFPSLLTAAEARLPGAAIASPKDPNRAEPAAPHPVRLPLGDDRVIAEHYGPKAAMLSRLRGAGFNVPEGYALDLSVLGSAKEQRHELQRTWDDLTRGAQDEPLEFIVRSSASVEDKPDALFAGRFESHRGVTLPVDLIYGVNLVVDSVNSEAVRDYADNLARASRPTRMGVIVQRQVKSVLAGVIFSRPPDPYQGPNFDYLVELVEGDADGLLRGDTTGTLYGITVDGDRVRHLAGPVIDNRVVTPVLAQVAEATYHIVEFVGQDQDIEWVWDGGDLFIVQSRPVNHQPIRPRRRRVSESDGAAIHASDGVDVAVRPIDLPMIDQWGLKACAAMYFGRLGCGAANAVLVDPDATENEVRHRLADRPPGTYGTVIRFSYKTNVGVPIKFVRPGEDLIDAYLAARQNPAWAGIVSDYVHIEGSFEAYVADSLLLVEYVPGNWEPSNTLPPDVFLWSGREFEFLRVASRRTAEFEVPSRRHSTGIMEREVEKLDDHRAAAWAERMIRHFTRIRADFEANLPLNVHFVVDSDDLWYFLNIRPTAHVDISLSERVIGNQFKSNRLYPVTAPDDIAGWDRQSEILLNIAVDRGKMSRVAGVAHALTKAGVTRVYSTFGVLSHPAIVLREFGLRVHPLYLDHERREIEVPLW